MTTLNLSMFGVEVVRFPFAGGVSRISAVDPLTPRGFITTGFVEEINEWLAKLGLAAGVAADHARARRHQRGLQLENALSTKRVDEILASIKQDKAAHPVQWFNSLREAYEAEDEDDDSDEC